MVMIESTIINAPVVMVKIDIDHDNPFALAMALYTLPNYEMFIRKSSNKGSHIKIFVGTKKAGDNIRFMLDDPIRFMFDYMRRYDNGNVLWDVKNGSYSSEWINATSRDFAQYCLNSHRTSLRAIIDDLLLAYGSQGGQ